MVSLWEDKHVTKINYKYDKSKTVFKEKFTPKDNKIYMDNIHASVTNSMSALDQPNVGQTRCKTLQVCPHSAEIRRVASLPVPWGITGSSRPQ